jgi:hypothetical protein
MILKGAGTSGSGKSTLARAFMALWDFKAVTLPGKVKVVEYLAAIKPGQPLSHLFSNVVVLGDYRNVCGGMDAIGDNDLRLSLVEQYCGAAARRTLVLYEGLLTGGTYGAMGAMSERSAVP